MERHTQPVPQAAADSPGRVDGDPDQQMEPRSARPQHKVEQSRGPVQEKQERLASVEVEANEQFVLSTTWSATERAYCKTRNGLRNGIIPRNSFKGCGFL